MLKFDASATFLFADLPLEQRFEKISNYGLRYVELQTLDGIDANDIAVPIAAADMGVVLINGPLGDFLQGGAGLVAVPGRAEEFRDAFKRSLQKACILKSPLINIGPSLITEGESAARSLDMFYDNLLFAADLASASGVRVVIEPLNKLDRPQSLLWSTARAVEAIRQVGSDNVGLQFDIYHTVMNGEDVLSEFTTHLPLIDHIQFSDAPGRGEPGTGTINFSAVFGAIKDSSYTGFVGAEYMPSRASDQTLQWLNQYAG